MAKSAAKKTVSIADKRAQLPALQELAAKRGALATNSNDPYEHREARDLHHATADIAESIGEHHIAAQHRELAARHAAKAPAEKPKAAGAEPAAAPKGKKLKAFAEGHHEGKKPHALQRGKKGDTYYVGEGGKKVYTGKA
jgi:hypothetical protein